MAVILQLEHYMDRPTCASDLNSYLLPYQIERILRLTPKVEGLDCS
jgi:hypothetical protein